MGIEKIKSCIEVARDNYKLAKRLYEETTTYNWVVVILYHSLLMYLKCLCECEEKIGNYIGHPKDHYHERDIVKKYLKTAPSYQVLLNDAYNFRYEPHIIINIQNKKNKPLIESYFKNYKKCVDEIVSKIKACDVI